MVKISAQRPTDISTTATVLLVIKTVIVKYYGEPQAVLRMNVSCCPEGSIGEDYKPDEAQYLLISESVMKWQELCCSNNEICDDSSFDFVESFYVLFVFFTSFCVLFFVS